MKMDDSQFQKRMDKLRKQEFPQRHEKALWAAGAALLRDALMVAPTVPLKDGWLRGSGSVHVNGKLKEESREGIPGKANKGGTGLDDKNTSVVGFNTPYAARLHEGLNIRNWSEPSSGMKYLESKLAQFKKQYAKVMARIIKEGR